MMTSDKISSLADDFLRIHKAITRGLTVGIRQGSDFILKGFPDQDLENGYRIFVETLMAVVSGHHLGEDEVAFPAFKQKLPAAPYEKLEDDHLQIQSALNIIKSALAETSGISSSTIMDTVIDDLKKIQEIWTAHIETEESAFSATALEATMTSDEQAEAAAAISKYAQEHGGPPYYDLPFVLFNLAPADRAEMTQKIPKTVVDELIPGEWKDKWLPMKPFLLD